jgi:hypothetical protein
MSPQFIPCANFPNCDRSADKPGEECAECKRKAAKAKADAWRYQGWTRQDERRQLQGKGKK